MHIPFFKQREAAEQNDVSAPAFSGDVYCRSLRDFSHYESNLLKEWFAVKVKGDALVCFDDKTGFLAVSVMKQTRRFDEICALCDSELGKARSEPDYFKRIGVPLILRKISAEENVERPSISNRESQLLDMLAFPFGLLNPTVFFRERRTER